MDDDERRSMLRSITDEQYDDIMRVLAIYPHITMKVSCEGMRSLNRNGCSVREPLFDGF